MFTHRGGSQDYKHLSLHDGAWRCSRSTYSRPRRMKSDSTAAVALLFLGGRRKTVNHNYPTQGGSNCTKAAHKRFPPRQDPRRRPRPKHMHATSARTDVDVLWSCIDAWNRTHLLQVFDVLPVVRPHTLSVSLRGERCHDAVHRLAPRGRRLELLLQLRIAKTITTSLRLRSRSEYATTNLIYFSSQLFQGPPLPGRRSVLPNRRHTYDPQKTSGDFDVCSQKWPTQLLSASSFGGQRCVSLTFSLHSTRSSSSITSIEVTSALRLFGEGCGG